MEKIWYEFRKKYDGEQSTRDAFNLLCIDLLERHFPGKIIESTSQISENISTEKSRVLYQTKYFLEDLSNSRKGQIRKAFNDSIIAHNPKEHPLFAWVLCVPMDFNDDESLWWYNWKAKMTEEYQVNIQLFDGEFIKELLDKYGLFEKWFGSLNNQNNTENIETEKKLSSIIDINDGLFELEDENISDENTNNEDIEFVIERKTEEQITEEEVAEIEKSENISENIELSEVEKQHLEAVNIEQNEISETNSDENEEPETDKLFSFNKLKKQNNKILKSLDSLDENQKSEHEIIFKKNKFPKERFDFETIETEGVSTADLVFKARQFKINELYEKALFVYEKIRERDDIKETANEEVEQGQDLCEKMIIYRNKISEGDIYFAKSDYLNALHSYEVAYFIDDKRKEIIKKYNFAFAEALVESRNYEFAILKYEEALKAEPNNQTLQDKRAFARLMHTGNKVFKKAPASFLNPLVAPFFYFQARNFDKKNADLNFKIKTVRKNLLYTLVAFMLLVVFILLIQTIPPVKREIVMTQANKITSMYEFQMQKGDYYLNNYIEEKVHYLDSAIYSYKNAIRFKPEDSIAPVKVEEAKKLKEEYIKRAQELIFLDSAAYFVSMRDPSEGLRLFKYLFEPYNKSKGKFGYVDEDMNIVVPPIFDFNYKKMLNAGEKFKDGRAFVCLKVNDNDTLYFYIDKSSNRVE